MTYGAWDFVPRKDYGLQLGRTLGDAFRELVTTRFRHSAAKQIERLWGVDPHTAKNIVQKGSVSERTLTKAARAEGWAFWMALGEAMFGQSYQEWEERRLTTLIEEAERDLARVRRLRPKTEMVAERSFAPRPDGVVANSESDQPSRRGGRRQ